MNHTPKLAFFADVSVFAFTCVVAVDVVLLRDPHICWNCTLISAKVSIITAMNTFWKYKQINKWMPINEDFIECLWLLSGV